MTSLYFVIAHYKEPLWSYSKQLKKILILANSEKEALKLAIPAFNSVKEDALLEDDWHSCTYSVKKVRVSQSRPKLLGAINCISVS